MESICLYKPRPRCEYRERGKCTKYIDEPIPQGHVGGQILPIGIPGGVNIDSGGHHILVPRADWFDGCCEYIKERGEVIKRVAKKRQLAWVHDLSIYEPFLKE